MKNYMLDVHPSQLFLQTCEIYIIKLSICKKIKTQIITVIL